ncbi:FKBP-type peptidyl-prolyl cis-trans isomerase [mine drainage metagenome]|uniref:peptidylprolyl isomerase n=1 Tax=mine drainage metagenome TaxID=410659 RepID=T1BK73_9ZZZZ
MNNGDFIKIDYSMRVGDEKKLVSTSIEQLAKDNSIFNENNKYGPISVIVGADQVFKKIDDSFVGSGSGQGS